MRSTHRAGLMRCGLLAAVLLLITAAASAQTTTFTYQGKLSDSGSPATGQYDFQFKLFDMATVGAGTQQGGPVTVSNVTVTAGIFTVQLDFGACAMCFNGAARYLEIAVKPTSGSTFTTLGPRQPVSSNPYAIRSLNATTADGLSVVCVNCITSGQIQSVQGSQVTGNLAGSQISGAIPIASVPAGSGNYIQNATSQQATSNFNISGNGTAGGTLSGNVVNAMAQYNLGGSRVLSNAGSFNLFAGVNAGNSNTGSSNSFFGFGAGQNNTTGQLNSFFGSFAGADNTMASFNSFFGQGAGQHNSTGHDNSFFGTSAGFANTGDFNSFFGSSAGQGNTTGQKNSFFGYRAGFGNTTQTDNAFFGYNAGANNITGNNSFFGSGAGQSNTTGVDNAFFGREAGANNTTANNNSFFGFQAGFNNTEFGNSFFGSGTGFNNTTGQGNSFFGWFAGSSNVAGFNNTFIGNQADFANSNSSGFDNTLLGAGTKVSTGVTFSTAIGFAAQVTTSHTIVLGTDQEVVDVPGKLQIDTLGAAGSTNLCLNSSNRVAPCSSSLRYKTNLQPFAGGLAIINRLQPISFTWKQGGMRDVGLGAEDVARVEPLLTFRNAKGEIEGVKYDRINVVLINAIKKQQSQIEQQQQQVKQQQERIGSLQDRLESLKRLVCQDHPDADACK